MTGKIYHTYTTEDAWEITRINPVEDINIEQILHLIYYPCWEQKGRNGDIQYVSIYQVLHQPEKFPAHIDRIRRADLNAPILIRPDRYDDRGVILDGNHRFAKAIINKDRTIKAKYISSEQLDAITRKI